MALIEKKRVHQTTYYVVLSWKGQRYEENAGTDKRKAESLHRKRKREIKNGTYQPPKRRQHQKFGPFAKAVARGWRNRSADNERDLLDNHVFCERRSWLLEMALPEIHPRDMLHFVEQIRAEGRLAEKSISTVYSLVIRIFKVAVFEGLISQSPCKLPKGAVTWKSQNRRFPYPAHEAQALMCDPAVAPDARMFNMLAFYTGMREGEVCGRRWRDWNLNAQPLSSLDVTTQYDDQPLKGDERGKTRPRKIPVHPDLMAALAEWWANGFALIYLRAPTRDDFIVPQRRLKGTIPHTKNSAYYRFKCALEATGLKSRTLHATRNTFVSLARNGGAIKEHLERITHNASGDTVDDYTTWEWLPICRAMLCVSFQPQTVELLDPHVGAHVGAIRERLGNSGLQRLDSKQGNQDEPQSLPMLGNEASRTGGAKNTLDFETRLKVAARQQRALWLALTDPEGAKPGLAATRALAAAYLDDTEAATEALTQMAEAMGLTGGKHG